MQLNFNVLLVTISCAYALPTVTLRQVQGNSTCDPRKYAQLVGGIQENMFIQKQELQGLQTLQSLSTASTALKAPANGTMSDFQLNQISITAIQQKAIPVRERNQRLADELSSPSAMGLAMVAQSQVSVMIDMKSLTGVGDADKRMLESLLGNVQEAMSQNEENLKMVDMGCRK